MKVLSSIALALGLVLGAGLPTSSGSAWAAAITDSGDPLLNGATIIDFSEVPIGTPDPTIDGVSFTGVSIPVTVSLFSNNPALRNTTGGTLGTSINVLFLTPVAAFAADFISVNFDLTIEAFDSSGDLLGSQSLSTPGGITQTFFLGLGGFGSDIAALNIVTNDNFRLDNFHIVREAQAVSEPASFAVLLIGLAGLAVARSRRRNSQHSLFPFKARTYENTSA